MRLFLALTLFFLSWSLGMATDQGAGAPIWHLLSSQFLAFMFGLAALIAGALVNARMNRNRDDRLRSEEAKAVAAALYGEILLLRKIVARAGNIVGHISMGVSSMTFDEHLLERVTLGDPILYPALASKLGLLDPNLVLAITKFHADYAEARIWLPKLVEKEGRPFSYSALYFLDPVQQMVFDIRPALRQFELVLGIPLPAEDPEMRGALSAIGIEEANFENSAAHD